MMQREITKTVDQCAILISSFLGAMVTVSWEGHEPLFLHVDFFFKHEVDFLLRDIYGVETSEINIGRDASCQAVCSICLLGGLMQLK